MEHVYGQIRFLDPDKLIGTTDKKYRREYVLHTSVPTIHLPKHPTNKWNKQRLPNTTTTISFFPNQTFTPMSPFNQPDYHQIVATSNSNYENMGNKLNYDIADMHTWSYQELWELLMNDDPISETSYQTPELNPTRLIRYIEP